MRRFHVVISSAAHHPTDSVFSSWATAAYPAFSVFPRHYRGASRGHRSNSAKIRTPISTQYSNRRNNVTSTISTSSSLTDQCNGPLNLSRSLHVRSAHWQQPRQVHRPLISKLYLNEFDQRVNLSKLSASIKINSF